MNQKCVHILHAQLRSCARAVSGPHISSLSTRTGGAQVPWYLRVKLVSRSPTIITLPLALEHAYGTEGGPKERGR